VKRGTEKEKKTRDSYKSRPKRIGEISNANLKETECARSARKDTGKQEKRQGRAKKEAAEKKAPRKGGGKNAWQRLVLSEDSKKPLAVGGKVALGCNRGDGGPREIAHRKVHKKKSNDANKGPKWRERHHHAEEMGPRKRPCAGGEDMPLASKKIFGPGQQLREQIVKNAERSPSTCEARKGTRRTGRKASNASPRN